MIFNSCVECNYCDLIRTVRIFKEHSQRVNNSVPIYFIIIFYLQYYQPCSCNPFPYDVPILYYNRYPDLAFEAAASKVWLEGMTEILNRRNACNLYKISKQEKGA